MSCWLLDNPKKVVIYNPSQSEPFHQLTSIPQGIQNSMENLNVTFELFEDLFIFFTLCFHI